MREQLRVADDGYELAETWSSADIDMGAGFDCEQARFWIQGEHGTIAACCWRLTRPTATRRWAVAA